MATPAPTHGRRGPTALVVAAADMQGASAAVAAAAADLVDLSDARAGIVAALRERHPGVTMCCRAAARLGGAGDPPGTGTLLIAAGMSAAAASQVPRAWLLVEVPLAEVTAALAAGLPPLVDLEDAALAAGLERPVSAPAPPADTAAVADILAIAAIASWLGAAAVRTRHPAQVRRALDMAASIRGLRPPALAVRGLA